MAVAAGVYSAGRDGGVCVHKASCLEVDGCVGVAGEARGTAGRDGGGTAAELASGGGGGRGSGVAGGGHPTYL